LVFDALAETKGVYLFDEVDALGGERARANDVGEIRRVLNSFLRSSPESTRMKRLYPFLFVQRAMVIPRAALGRLFGLRSTYSRYGVGQMDTPQ
jgi:hypothetical protein